MPYITGLDEETDEYLQDEYDTIDVDIKQDDQEDRE